MVVSSLGQVSKGKAEGGSGVQQRTNSLCLQNTNLKGIKLLFLFIVVSLCFWGPNNYFL